VWILPKQLLTLVSAPDTEALTSDCDEFCQLAEQSLLAKSSPSPSRTWLRKWTRDKWMRVLSGRTLKRCHWNGFQRAFLSCRGVFPVSHLAAPAKGEQTTTLDTSSPT
jgi:hypothetical protein